MEEILDTYKLPYKKGVPVVCMDEKPYQLLDHVLSPLQVKPGSIRKEDAGYKRKGTCNIFVFAQPPADYRHVSIKETRTMVDWAQEIEYLLTVNYPDKEKVILVMDNLNTHTYASLYKTFLAEYSGNRTKCHDASVFKAPDIKYKPSVCRTNRLGK